MNIYSLAIDPAKQAQHQETPHDLVACSDDVKALKTAHERRPVKTYLVTVAAAGVSGFMSGRGIIEKAIEAGVADEIGMGSAIMSGVVACAFDDGED